MSNAANISNSNYSSLGGENPVFKFDNVNYNGHLEDRKTHKTQYDDPQEEYVIGNWVSGIEIKSNKTVSGEIISINHDKEGSEGTAEIIDTNEKKYVISFDSLKRTKNPGKQEKEKLKSFNEWKEFVNEGYSYKKEGEKAILNIEELFYKDSFFSDIIKRYDVEFDSDTYPTMNLMIYIKSHFTMQQLEKEWNRFCKEHKYDNRWEVFTSETTDSIVLNLSEPNYKR